MRKWLGMAVAGLVALACVATAQAETKYAVCVGINKYKEISSLSGCVNDANYFYTNLVTRGGWQKSNMTLLKDSGATKAAIRRAVSNCAAKAVSGDVFVYQQSSHGGQESGTDTYLCVYDEDYYDNSTAYNDYEIAADMASFAAGVKVVVIVDACHSGGLFKDAARAKVPFDLAGRVTAIMNADRAARLARGERGIEKKLSASEIGWVTAANYNESSLDGGYYDSNRWMSNSSEEGNVMGGVFLGAFTWGWWDGSADTRSGYGDNDGYADPYECWRAGYVICTNKNLQGSDAFTPQCTNITVLRSVELGWVGDEEPSGVRFASIPAQTATVGQALNYTVLATNSDGSTGPIKYSVTSSTAPSGSYSVNATSGAFTFTPATDGTFTFDFVGTNSTAHTFGKASMSVTATLAAPAKLSNSGITDNSFTANWGAVAGAASYILEVYAVDAATASKAADSAFELVTSDDGLTEGEYVILGENADNAMNNTCSGDSSGNMGCTEVTVSGSTVSAEDASIIWTLAGDASSCTLFNAVAGKFVNPATARSCGWSDTASGSWTLSASDGVVSAANSASSKWKLQYNSSSPRFAMYESTQKNLRFFRRDGGSGAVFSGDVGNVTSFTVTDLIPGDYTWRVRAVGNAKGPFSDVQEVSLVSDPTAPPSIRPIDDIKIIVGETATATVVVSTPEEAPVTSLSITAGDAAAKLGEDGVFTFAPAAPGEYSFTITAVNANDSASVSFSVTATLAAPVAAEATAVGATGFTANWAAVAGAQSYLLTVVEGAAAPSGEAVTDTLTADGFHLASTYGDGSYVSEASGAEYEAYAMKKSGGTAIQLNSKNGIGIVTTVSAGNVTEVRVSFDSSTKSGNTLNVYGSADAYSASSDLYSDSTAGRLLGTIVYDGSTAEGSFAIPASCPFVGLRSASGAIYLDFVEVEWNGSAKAARAQGDIILDAVDVGNVTSHDVTGLSMLTQYSYTVAAKAGDVVSEDSEAISVTTLDAEVAPAWSAIPEQSATLGEPFVLDFSSYLVAKPAATVTASAGSVDGTVLTFTPDAAGPTTVTLTAVNTMGSATATVVIVAVPAAPEVVDPTTVSSNSFVATWVAVEGAQKYHLVVVEAAAASGTARAAGDVVFEGDVTGTSREITGLAPETAYSYTVAAIVDGVTGPASEPVAVTTKAGPAAPSWSAIPAQNTYVGATFQLDLSAFLSGNPEPTVTADVGTVTGLNYVCAPENTGPVTVTLTAVNDSGTTSTTFVLTVSEAPTGGTHYAVVVGCNNYATGYASSLKGAVPDANHVYSLITTRGAWETANVTKLTDSAAKHDAIRAAISNAAANAVAGDTFLYFQSSHGGNWSYTFVTNDAPYADYPTIVYGLDPAGEDNFICSYNANYTAAEMAADLAAFDPAVNVVVMLDTCHSAGMFKYDASRGVRRRAPAAGLLSASPDLFAEAVAAQLGAIRRARGIRAPSNVGFVTAADFNEYSWDSQDGNGGEFTTAFIDGVTNGVCDNAEYGDQDGWATFYEGWNYAKDIALGCVNDPEVDENGYALYDNTAYAEEYNEPDYYYDYNFTHAQITNEAVLRAVRVGYAGNPTLDAPVAAPAADVTDSSFTASWSAVADATAYRLQVATDESFSTGAASDTLTAGDLKATGTSYTDFSGVTKPSGAVYAGKTAKNSGAIQLNDSKSAGIWTTASGGNVSRVAVVWNTSPASGRSVKVYGSATPLASYSDASAADLIGTLSASVTSLDVTNTYAYVGILPSGGAIYLDSVTIDWGTADSESSIVLDENVGTDTSVEVTGLEADTDYFYRVQALGGPVDSDFSNVISLTTEGGIPAAPAWDEIPEQTVVAGENLVVDLNDYVSGSPKPTITADAGTVENGVLTVSFADEGEYTVTVTAENSEGSDSATFAVTVTAAPVTVPVLTLSNPTATTFDADWTACTGASSYQFQVATDDQFTPAGAGGTFTLVESDAGLTAGDYVILAADTDTAMNNTCSGDSSGNMGCTEVTVSGSTVSTEDADIIWTLAGDASSCTLFNADAGKFVNPATTRSCGWSDTASGSWTLSASDGVVSAANSSSSKWKLQYNSGSPRFAMYESTQKNLRFFRRDSRSAKDGGSLVIDDTISENGCTVEDLEPETTYYARVRMADGEWSGIESIATLPDAPVAPEWLELPDQTATVGLEFGIDLSSYVTGSPFPVITVDGVEAVDGNWTFTPDEAGTFTFELVATNSEGSDSETLTVVVSEAPSTIPVLTLSNATDSTFDAEWTACTGAETYQFQVATDDQFTPGGGGSTLVETFDSAVFSKTSSSYTNQTITGGDLGDWTATECRGDRTNPVIRAKGTLTSPSLAGGVAAVEFDYDWPFKETGTCGIDLYVNGDKVADVSIAGGAAGTSGTALFPAFDAVAGPATIEFRNTATADKRLRVTEIRITAASKSAKDGEGSLIVDETTSDLSCTVEGLDPDTTYYARVRMAEGEWSAVESIATTGEGPTGPAKYALCVGLNEYDYEAWDAQGWEIGALHGCVNDATYMKKNLTERGGWADADVTLLTDAAATKDALRAAIAAAAAKAKAGDTFVYQHSSHGLNNDEDPYGKDVALATYAAPYEDFELAEDLAAFADGVKVVIAIDACHSGGMFKKGAKASAASFDIAARVSALMDATLATRKARGEDVSRNLSSDQVGWITAANYDEESKDGGYYDTDEWMSDEDAEGNVPGGTFLASLTWGWWSGKADVSGTGDGDGWFDAYEGWGFASPVCIEEGFTPQFLNEDVLRSVELGYAGETAPSEAILFDPVPGATVGIGEEARLTVVAKKADGTTEGITLSIIDAPEGADYAFSSETGTLTFTPDEDGLFLFTVQAVNGRTSATKLLGVTAVLPAPVALDATDTDDDSFTANWTGVDAARGYELQVSTDPNFPEDEPDTVVKEGFDNVTTDVSSLPEGWEFSGEFKIYTTTASSGEAPPSIQLKPNDATLTTPEFKLRRMGGLSFWTKGNGSGTNMTSVLKVEQLVGEDWQELDSFTPTTASAGETKRYENVDLDATRFRFVMSKPDGAVGNIAIDDVMVITLPAGAAMVLEDEIPAGTTSCAVEDLDPGTTYYYRVRAIANTASAWSETIEVTTTGEAPVPVPELTALISETMPDSALFAFWTCEGVSEYRMQVATDEGFASLVYDEVLAEDTKTVTGLSPETTYYVRVCGLVGERVGDWSNVERVTTAAGAPQIDDIAIDTAAGTFSFTVKEGTSVETATDLVAGDWAPYEGEVGEDGLVSMPMDTPSAFYRLVPSAD